jgi:hypothetical protein
MVQMTNIVTIGGCAAADILRSPKNNAFIYKINSWYGSVSRQSWDPGKVASRLKEHVPEIRASAAMYPSDVSHTEDQLNHTIKEWRTPISIINSLPENSVVIFDPAYELMRFYFDGNEIFDIELTYGNRVRKHMPEWFYSLVDKHTLRFDCGISEIARFQFRAINDFMKTLDRLNIPTIAVDNVFTRKIYDPITNSIVDAIPQWNAAMPFQWNSSNHLVNYEYANNLVSRFYEMFRERLPKNFKLFSPSAEHIYADLDHYLGYHPTHLHHSCRQMLNADLSALIVEVLAEHKTRQSLILPDHSKKINLRA